MSAQRTCVTCRWYEHWSYDGMPHDTCHNPTVNATMTRFSKVHGPYVVKPDAIAVDCYVQRNRERFRYWTQNDDEHMCGPEGKFWEPGTYRKPSLFRRLFG